MYKVATDLSQRRARQLWLANLVGKHFEDLPSEHKLENLRRALRGLHAAMSGLPNGPERTHLLGLMDDVRSRIIGLRPKRAAAPADINKHFIDVARAQLSPYQFKLILMEAMRRASPTIEGVDQPASN